MSADVWDVEDGCDGAPAVRKLLAEAGRALEFDRAHLVLVADRVTTRELPRLLGEALAGEVEVVVVHLAGHEESVADRVADAIRDARRSPLLPDVARGDRRGRLALVLPDALSIPAASLRALNEMATRSGMTQRLVLLVDRDATAVDDPARELVARLGAGVSKVELESGSRPQVGPRIAHPDERTLPSPATPMPPVVSDTRARRVRPVRVRARRRPGSRHPLRWIAATGTLGLAILLLTAPGSVRRLVTRAAPGDPEVVQAPVSAANPVPEPAAESSPSPRPQPSPSPRPQASPSPPPEPEPEPKAVAELQPDDVPEGPELPPVGIPRLSPAPEAPTVAADIEATPSGEERGATAVSTPDVDEPNEEASARGQAIPAAAAPVDAASAPREATPAPAPVIVSFNAAPWANLEVDGRNVGATPIGDLALVPGRHHLRATFPDGRVVERSLRVDSLQNRFRIE